MFKFNLIKNVVMLVHKVKLNFFKYIFILVLVMLVHQVKLKKIVFINFYFSFSYVSTSS